MPAEKTDKPLQKVRVDKWLWAARFFKTRNLAKQAIDGGKVHINGQRVKASKEIEAGALLTIRKGWDEVEVEAIALSEQRRGAPEAALLYSETEASVEKRKLYGEQRKSMRGLDLKPETKPNTKQRRQISRFKRDIFDDNL